MTGRRFTRDLLGAAGVLLFGAATGLIAHPESLQKAPAIAVPENRESFVAATIPFEDAKRYFEKGECIILDVRQPDAFRAEHIPGALPLHALAFRPEWRALRRWLPLDQTVLVVGENAVDYNPPRFASQLRAFGVKLARVLDGGMDAWKKGGMPLAHGWDAQAIFEAEKPR